MKNKDPLISVEDAMLKTLKRPSPKYLLALAFTSGCVLFGALAWAYQIFIGIGASGKRHPVMWALYITNFVFWVGIAHSGTLISAILYLFRAKWRTSISRAAEAMTVFAIMTAGLFPLIHLGRVWKFYWLIPYPNQRGLWINFKSPLIWDVFAVTTYFLVSLFFFYLGLIPDIALIRDRSTGLRKTFYSILSLGWSGSSNQWWHYNKAYLLLAGIATPLVISVHSVVSWDFAMSIVPGWHSTIFAPYFVAGAVFSGTAMIIMLLVPLRKAFHLEEYITIYNFENLAKVLIFMSLIITYSYTMEFFTAWYSNNIFEQETFYWRAFGFYKNLFWFMFICNSILPLLFFLKKVRRNIGAVFLIAVFINIGMWLERFIIIVTSLAHDFDPYVWRTYHPTIIDCTITMGGLGFFLTLFLVFVKVFPAVSISETRHSIIDKISPLPGGEREG